MKRKGMVWILGVLMQSVWGQADPLFLLNKSPITAFESSDGIPWSNPAVLKVSDPDSWQIGITNHAGIHTYNTLYLAGRYEASEQLVISTKLRHNILGHSQFSRSLLGAGASLTLSDRLAWGVLLQGIWMNLPEPLAGSGMAGGVTGIMFSITNRIESAVSGGYHRTIPQSDLYQVEHFTTLSATMIFHQSKHAHFLVSMEAVQGIRPWIMAGFNAEITPKIRLMAGCSTGHEQLFAGLRYTPGKISCSALSGFHPMSGMTQSLWISKKTTRP